MRHAAQTDRRWRMPLATPMIVAMSLLVAPCPAEEPSLKARAEALKTISEAGGGAWPDIAKLQAAGEKRDFFNPKRAFVRAHFERVVPTDRAIDALAEFPEIERLSLSDGGITDVQLGRLPVPKLKHLDLSGTKITDRGIENLWPLKKLEELDLSRTAVTGRGLTTLATLQNLRSVHLNETAVDDAGIAHLSKLPMLRELGLGKTNVGDAALEHLRKATNLEYLGLYGTRVTDTGMASLRGLAKLARLQLSETGIGDKGIEAIEQLPNIETLRLDGTRITDAAAARIARWKKLTHLDLDGTLISDVGAERLRDLTKLNWLSLEVTQITDAALESLIDMRELEVLVLTDTPITDAGLDHLAKLPALQVLDLSGTQISDPRLTALKGLPKLRSLDVSRTQVTSLDVFLTLPRTRAHVRRIQKALDEKTELDFVFQSLSDVLEYMNQRHGVEIQIDHRSLADGGVDIFRTPITLKVDGITLREALKKILDPLKLIFTVRYEVLLIGGKTLADPVGDFPIVPAGQRLSPQVAEAFMRAVSIDFAEKPFADVVRSLGEMYRIPFEIDGPSLTAAGIGFDTPVTRSLGGVTLKSALELMFADLDLICVVEGDKVIVRTKPPR